MNKRIRLVVSALLVCATTAMGQKNFYKEAEKKFNSFEYFAAIDLYKAAYKKSSKKIKPECLWKTAECYRFINDVKQAEVYYQKAIKAKCEQSTLAVLYLADVMKQQEKYADAKLKYEEYAKEVPSDERGTNGSKSCELAQKWKENPTRYKMENMVQINTKDWDYCPMYAERKKYSTLLFSSTRQGATGEVDINVGQLYSDLFMAKVDKNGKWSTPIPLPAPISTKNNEAACVLDEKGSTMYYTGCASEKNKNQKCHIYSTIKRGQSWEVPVLLPFNIDSFSYGHPALSKDGSIMIFSSDVNDISFPSNGGLDLYYVALDPTTKTWGSQPVNLGPEINTAGDEAFPFINYDGTLYFASTGHMGMGGLDIFRAEATGTNKWTKPENMQSPVNSAGDDFAIIFESDRERGYLTSNRAGGKGGDDIYSFILPPLIYMLEGFVTEELTKLPVPNATVKLVGSDNTSFEIKTDVKGYYRYETNGLTRYINSNTSYVVSASALDVKTPDFPDGLLGNPKAKITTVGLTESTDLKQNFALKKIIKEMRMPLVLFNLDKYDLDHPSNPKDSLEFLVKTMSENPNITVELSAHTDYRSDAKYNQTLSFNRAKTCVDYLISEKGIDPARISPAGYGESRPSELQTDVTLPGGKVVRAGTVLSQKWIDKEHPERKNKDDYEFIMQINRRVVFTILRKDYVPSETTEGQPKGSPEIKVTNSESEGGEGDSKTEWDDDQAPQSPPPPETAPQNTTVTPKGTPPPKPKQ